MVFVYLHKQKSAKDLEKLGHSIDVSPLIKSIEDLSTAAQRINIEKEVMALGLHLKKLTSKNGY